MFVAFAALTSGSLLSFRSGNERANISWNYFSPSGKIIRMRMRKRRTPNVRFAMGSNELGFFLLKEFNDGIAGIFGISGSLGTAGSASRMMSFQNRRRIQTMKKTTSALEWFCMVRGR